MPIPKSALLLPLALAACSSGADYAAPSLPVAPALKSGTFLRAEQASAIAPVARWWESLGDAQLTALIDKGLASAANIAAMRARLQQARARIDGSKAALRPSVSGSAIGVRADLPGGAFGSGGGTTIYGGGFDSSWEIDLSGGKHREIERSIAESEAREAQLADAQVSLSAEIARSYIMLRSREAGLALLDQRRKLEARIQTAAQQRFAGGTAPAQPLEAARIQQQRSGAERALLAAEITILRDSLAVLSGDAPGTLDDLPDATIPLPPAELAIGDPAGMLARRPDIRAAERQIAAATAQIGVEAARRFPKISLAGMIGLGGISPNQAGNDYSLTSIAMPRLSWALLDFGRITAAKKGAEAARDAALAEYQARVLGALQDAEAALTRFGAARISLAEAGSVATHTQRIANLQIQRAQAGTTSPAEAMSAQRQAIDAQIAQASKRAALSITYVALAKALGLGWKL
jgi:outer membrane protein, multidrug efflux system